MTVVRIIDDSSNVTMAIDGCQMILDHLDWSPRRIHLKDAIFCSLFYDDLAFRLGLPCCLVFRVSPQSSFDLPSVGASDSYLGPST